MKNQIKFYDHHKFHHDFVGIKDDNIIWSNFDLSDLKKKTNNKFFNFNNNEEIDKNDTYDYDFKNEYKFTDIKNKNDKKFNISPTNNAEINTQMIQIIELTEYNTSVLDNNMMNQLRKVNEIKNKDNKSVSPKIKEKKIKLHKDIYSDKAKAKTSIFNNLIKVISTISFISLLIFILFPQKKTEIFESKTFSQPVLESKLNYSENVLEFNSIPNIEVENIKPEITNNSPTENKSVLENTTKLNSSIPSKENFEDSIIVDRYYLPQENESNVNDSDKNPMLIMDRYYLPQNYYNYFFEPEISPNNTSFASNTMVSDTNQLQQTYEEIPTPPLLEVENTSSIPIISESNSPEITTNNNEIIDLDPIIENQTKTYIFNGIMNVPNQESTAIFESDNLFFTIKIGEPISSKGWILENIENEQVTLSQNGEKLILRVGESVSITED